MPVCRLASGQIKEMTKMLEAEDVAYDNKPIVALLGRI